MAKNMESTTYRKIDVDALDDDKFVEGEDGAISNGQAYDESNVLSLLQAGRGMDALRAALSNPPLASKDQALKDRTTILVAKVLQSFKSAEIEAAVGALSEMDSEILLKFVYRSFSLVEEAAICHSLLLWHAQIVARFGIGCIVRVLSSRPRL